MQTIDIEAIKEEKRVLELSLAEARDKNSMLREKVDEVNSTHGELSKELQSVQGQLVTERSRILKLEPKWNDALLEMFRINYIGTSPYITCLPSLYHHHQVSPRDKFLIMSSDGLYQYFINEEAVSEAESFIAAFPKGDPAQHLIKLQVHVTLTPKPSLGLMELESD
ncbi:hypothetical protein Patl1_21803 [Pistacia atlantica]|uniref:Uncharacterized protein n=1 Tax=Pistacia atlantica TaxID=434234 RepID=A0ACC1BI97_9ROSI|nr:hypothetical protein Patl1_21803 [Pistacia atlantica]